MKYRNKPVVIEAEKWEGANLNDDNSMFQDLAVIIKSDGSGFIVGTPDCVMTGKMGDWLIRGVKGKLYPCRDDIFRATYEAVGRSYQLIEEQFHLAEKSYQDRIFKLEGEIAGLETIASRLVNFGPQAGFKMRFYTKSEREAYGQILSRLNELSKPRRKSCPAKCK